MTVKIKTSVINSVNIDGAKVNVSLNQDGVSFSMPYETDEIKLKEKLKCKVTFTWDGVLKELQQQWEDYDKQVAGIVADK
jgi:hypothetical protein